MKKLFYPAIIAIAVMSQGCIALDLVKKIDFSGLWEKPEEVPEFLDEIPIDGTKRSNEADLKNFKVTHDLRVEFVGNLIHFDQTLTDELSAVSGSAGNVCKGLMDSNGKWIWDAYDWIGVNSKSKARHEIGNVPSGTVIGFCVSSHIRQHWRNGNVRTKTVKVIVP